MNMIMIMGIFTAILDCVLLGAIFYNVKCARNYRKMYREAEELRMKIFLEMEAGNTIARLVWTTGDFPDTIEGCHKYIQRQIRFLGQSDRRIYELRDENSRLWQRVLELLNNQNNA